MSGFVRKYAIVSYYILALILGTGVTLLVVQGVLPSSLIVIAAFSASLSGIIITAISDGKEGLKVLFGRLLIWRVSIGWWLFALLFLGLATPLAFLLNPLFGGDPIDVSNGQPLYPFVPMLVLFFLTAALGEELGWTGFLIPRLQVRYNALVSSSIRSVLWGLWHFPLFLFVVDARSSLGFPYHYLVSQYGSVIAMGAFILIHQLPWSILYTWIFNNTKGSLLLVAVLHGAEVWLACWELSTGVNPNNFDNYWGYGLVMVVTAVIIVIISGAENLSRKNERIMHQ